MLTHIRCLAVNADPTPASVAVSTASLIWGLLLLDPSADLTHACYGAMRQIMSESAWACLFLAFGLAQLWVIVDRRRCTRFAHPVIRGSTAFVWLYVASLLVHDAGSALASAGGELSIALCAVWAFVKGSNSCGLRGCEYAGPDSHG